MYFSKQHSVLFLHCEMSERICPARTVPETTVALTVVEKRCLLTQTDEGCVIHHLIKYIIIFQFKPKHYTYDKQLLEPPLVACGDTLPLITKGGKQGGWYGFPSTSSLAKGESKIIIRQPLPVYLIKR